MGTRLEPPIQIKTPGELAAMRRAGLVVAHTLDVLAHAVEPGISTADLDALAEGEIRGAGGVPSFKGYHGYPGTICTSVNDQIVHGIPSPRARLAAGDVISIDCGAILDGWHADAARTVGVGPISDELTGLLRACELALWHGLAMARPGRRLTDISHAVEVSARARGRYGIVREYVGHGIGTEMHMDPPVPNYGRAGRGPLLAEGMALAIEPMLVLGRPQTRLLDDDWTVVTADGSWAAHFEHTVAITADGPWVLTAEDGGASGFERLRPRGAAGPRPAAEPTPVDHPQHMPTAAGVSTGAGSSVGSPSELREDPVTAQAAEAAHFPGLEDPARAQPGPGYDISDDTCRRFPLRRATPARFSCRLKAAIPRGGSDGG